MKIKDKIKKSSLIIAAMLTLFACKKKDPSIDDYFLNYKIPEVPVTSNYTIGAFYYSFTTFNANVPYNPVLGKYTDATTGIVPANVIQAHIDQAASAKIDYFIFSLRSPTMDANNYKVDSLTTMSFLGASNASKMNFAVMYNLSTGTLGISNAGNPDPNNPTVNRGTPLEANATKLENFYRDFQRLAFYMKQPNYQKVNGKPILIINHAQDLNSNMDPANPGSNAPVYKEIRKRLNALGLDVYIVGEQDQWSVPNNYFYRYENCVDAVYEANMAEVKGNYDRYYLFGTMTDQNFAYWKKELESWPAGGLTPGQKNLEFIPCIQGGYNYQYKTPTNLFPAVKSADWYRTYTNVAKRNCSASKLIFIDSFNNWSVDTQIEATVPAATGTKDYGTTYLDITRQEFKVN